MERFFTNINRINSVLLLLVLLGGAGSIAWMTLANQPWTRRGAVDVVENESGVEKIVRLNFGRVENITGANTQMMVLTTEEKSARFSSGGYGSGDMRNVLFLTGDAKAARWLFKDQKNLISVTGQLKEEAQDSKDRATQALYFEYVSQDTNHDGTLSALDHVSVGLAKPNGMGFTEVLQGLSRVLSHDLIDSKTLSVVYQKGDVVRHARFSLDTNKLLSDQEIVNVPKTL